MSNSKYVVVISACIDPSNGSIQVVSRSDPSIRLQDYINGLHFWLNIPDRRLDKIVFIENSGYPLDALQKLTKISNPLNKQVEFISLCCNDYPEGVHYGYAELNMIDKAFTLSKLLNESCYFIKATGRLTFPTISCLLDRLIDDYMFAVDCRNNAILTPYPQVFATTQLMIFSTSFYNKYLLNIKSELSKDMAFVEGLLYRKLMTFKDEEGAILRWPINVDPSGYSSGWSKNYDSPKQKIINKVRSICRIIFPNWWV